MQWRIVVITEVAFWFLCLVFTHTYISAGSCSEMGFRVLGELFSGIIRKGRDCVTRQNSLCTEYGFHWKYYAHCCISVADQQSSNVPSPPTLQNLNKTTIFCCWINDSSNIPCSYPHRLSTRKGRHEQKLWRWSGTVRLWVQLGTPWYSE